MSLTPLISKWAVLAETHCSQTWTSPFKFYSEFNLESTESVEFVED